MTKLYAVLEQGAKSREAIKRCCSTAGDGLKFTTDLKIAKEWAKHPDSEVVCLTMSSPRLKFDEIVIGMILDCDFEYYGVVCETNLEAGNFMVNSVQRGLVRVRRESFDLAIWTVHSS